MSFCCYLRRPLTGSEWWSALPSRHEAPGSIPSNRRSKSGVGREAEEEKILKEKKKRQKEEEEQKRRKKVTSPSHLLSHTGPRLNDVKKVVKH